MLNRLKALQLLAECTGDDLWSLDYCRQQGIPATWLEELQDCYESDFSRDSQTIYRDNTPVNQYEGVRDVDLAMKLGAYLNLDVAALQSLSFSRADLVRRIHEAIEEDDF